VGDALHPHVPEHYVSKAEVDAAGEHIAKVRTKPAKTRRIVVPDAAIDECEDGHIAGTGTKTKTNPERYNDTGTMALLCRHDIPLFLANIDTPGEQQKYAVALIQKLYSMLPETATVAVFYDVACVLNHSLQKVGDRDQPPIEADPFLNSSMTFCLLPSRAERPSRPV
jgi:hypothetical protein